MAHAPLRNEADPEWQAIHAAAEQDEARVSRLLLAAFAALAARTVLLGIRSALRFGNVEAAMQAVPVAQLLTLRSALEAALIQTALEGARVGLGSEMVVRLGSSVGLPVAELTFWARQHSAALVVGITEQTRRALRKTIVQALQAGLSPARAAPLIEATVGLNTVQVGAILRRYDELVEAGVTAARRQAILSRYAARLRRQRAQTIARHELALAANEGRRAIWTRDVRDGLIAPDRWIREWVGIVPSDGRTCAYCQGQDGQTAPINGVYPDGSSGPPGHVICRCTEVLRRVA
jgi:hypothetical protein